METVLSVQSPLQSPIKKTKYPKKYTQQKKFFDVIWDMGDFPENTKLTRDYDHV